MDETSVTLSLNEVFAKTDFFFLKTDAQIMLRLNRNPCPKVA